MAEQVFADESVSTFQLHPLTVLFAWLCGVIALQRVAQLLFPFLMTATVALVYARATFIRLLSRSRWLLLALVASVLWLTPGSELTGWGGRLGLTAEGCITAQNHLLGFLSVLGLIALVLARLDSGRLIFGIYVLMTPLALIGLDRDRLAVRLMLTLNQASGCAPTIGKPATLAIEEQKVLLLPASWSGVDLVVVATFLFMLVIAFLA